MLSANDAMAEVADIVKTAKLSENLQLYYTEHNNKPNRKTDDSIIPWSSDLHLQTNINSVLLTFHACLPKSEIP